MASFDRAAPQSTLDSDDGARGSPGAAIDPGQHRPATRFRTRWDVPKGAGEVRVSHRAWWPVYFLAPAALLYGMFVCWPLVSVGYMALERWDGYTSAVFIGLGNFATLGADPGFGAEVRHTLVWLVVTLTVPVLVGLLLALLLHQVPAPWRAVLRGMLVLPLLLPTVVIAVAWYLVYNPLVGLVNPILQALPLGLQAQDWLGDPHLALASVLLVACWSAYGISLLLCEAGLAGISGDVVAAAQLDGAGALARFTAVTLPALRGVLPLAIVATGCVTLPSYDLVSQLTEGGPGYATTTLALDSYGRAFGGLGQVGVAAALAVLQAAIGVVLAIGALVFARGMAQNEVESGQMPYRRASSLARPLAILGGAAGPIAMAPLIWLVVLALRPSAGISLWSTITGNLSAVWSQGMGSAAITSLYLALCVSLVTVVLALPAAYALAESRVRPLQIAVAFVLTIGLFQPVSVIIIPLFSFEQSLSLLDTPLGVAAPQSARALAMGVLILWIGIRTVPRAVIEAAKVDGAGPAQVLSYIIVPLAWPVVLVVAVWSFLVSWNDYMLPLVVLVSGTVQTVPLALAQFIGRSDTEYGLLATGALLALVPVVLLYGGLYRILAQGLRTLGAFR
jgi:ABC-type sugar transport system permease subunit